MKSRMTILSALAPALLFSPIALAGPAGKTGADAGFERLKTNVGTAKANLDDYKKNLTVVEGNLREVAKARGSAEEQRKQTGAAVKDNGAVLAKFDKQEKEIAALMADEKSKMTAEEKKMAELEGLIARIKENRAKREANVSSYQQQLAGLQGERKAWQVRGEALDQQDNQAKQRVKELTALENEQKGKKKGYEGEIGRWNKEVEKQQKTLNQYQSLADAK